MSIRTVMTFNGQKKECERYVRNLCLSSDEELKYNYNDGVS